MKVNVFYPFLINLRRQLVVRDKDHLIRISGIVFMGVLVFGVSYWAFVKALVYFRSIEIVGEFLVRKLMSIIYLVFLFALFMSNLITSFSTFFFSDDLSLLMAMPLSKERLFVSRYLYTLLLSSWIISFFFFPVIGAYSTVYGTDIVHILWTFFNFIVFLIIPCSVGSLICLLIVAFFPARKARDFIFIASVIFGVGIYVMIRLLRPERLANPEVFRNLAQYLSSLTAPEKFYLPSYWLSRIGVDAIILGKVNLKFSAVLLTGALSSIYVVYLVYLIFYYRGWNRAQEARGASISTSSIFEKIVNAIAKPFGNVFRALLVKDIKVFFRDPAQWSQIFLLTALVVVYIYNYKVLPLKRIPFPSMYVKNFIAFLNEGLAGFVLSAVAARFVYSAISLEGKAMWVIKGCPVKPKKFLISKAFMSFIPLFFLGEILIVGTNILMSAHSVIMVSSVVNIAFIIVGLVSMGMGMGALYPNFEYENVAQIPMGYGGFVYMLTSLLYVAFAVFLSAFPVYNFFRLSLGFSVSSEILLISQVSLVLLFLLHAFVIKYFYDLSVKTFERMEV